MQDPHMIGVPMIAMSVPMLLISPGVRNSGWGWALQFIGHYVFEKKQSGCAHGTTEPMVILAHWIFVAEVGQGFQRLPYREQYPSDHSNLINGQR